jgi:Zn-dependent protease/predicted transcriptional regulator
MVPTQGWTIGWLGGVEIKVNASLLLIAFLVTYLLASAILPVAAPQAPVALYWFTGLLGAVIFIGSILWHEMAHVVMALRFSIPVMQVVLHLYGGVALLSREPERPSHEFVITIAGPLSSLLLAVVFGLFSTLDGLVGAMFGWLAQVNFTLALFNLLPGFPLDGGRVLRSILWRVGGSYKVATRQASRVGQFVALIFVAFGLWLIFNRALFNGLWFLMIAFFLYTAASQAYQMAAGTSLPLHTDVRRVMRYNVPLIEPSTPLALLAWRYLDHARDQAFPVAHHGRLVGLVTSAEVDKFPRLEWGRIRVEQIMIPVEKLPIVSPNHSLEQALAVFDKTGMNYAPVIDGDAVIGMLNRRDIVYRT